MTGAFMFPCLAGKAGMEDFTMRTRTQTLHRWTLVLPVATMMTTMALAGCKGKDDDTQAPAPPGPAASPMATGSSTPGTNPQTTTPGAAPGGPGGTMMNKPSTNPNGAVGDAIITAKVKSALIKDTIASTINVNTKSGTVVLQGKVANAKDKTTAISDAKQIEGVKNVIDHLSIKP